MTATSPSAVLSFFFFVQELSLPCVLATLSAKGIRRPRSIACPPPGGDGSSPAPGKMGRNSLKLIRLYARGQLLVSKEHLVPVFLLWPRDSGSESPQIWREAPPQQNDWEMKTELSRVPTSAALPMAPKLPRPAKPPSPEFKIALSHLHPPVFYLQRSLGQRSLGSC